ncbi:MAG: hypothetical protein A3G33_06180 [Omnitrophica bacterium RIFCSPLOWO2_12_FULL_44_17]|uniref:Response regulatory domain-containing protein n=1 Tax=Candidatus Danuiimicrobium aquiferis TaxID=1801832 RepID=A0A1G1KR09_9BACT|nr:MAG: hypothetical protein A3B72_02665 [Omnitrophica bacterium RIFCSPHIGHO2_02_FULL_45_28]OGW88077.1 MAG: hypothetical protein A3E74_00615 [Omnitrophica bacterium RIFCSPHIGHO2_12_FULL_44_12]OGW95371.1 MAG: hypothetical protein A3G33_06180 [Omnitrophica bacterium RIFCSPLOWO2_12_FULL_44_17]OGX04073.1 MAG: hypothetical protein A3J12_08745 [Omnitrophica bacterium RIFCSPLOWO2_02_FULL_44_11]
MSDQTMEANLITQIGKPINILLAEDNEADVKITLRAFDKARLKNNIFVVRDGEEALDFIYHRGKYSDATRYPKLDLVLLDIKMPKVDGLEVLKKLKSDPVFKMLPVVMLTSSKNEQDIVTSYMDGASSYIPKPVSFQEFIEVVNGFNFYWQIISKLPDGF